MTKYLGYNSKRERNIFLLCFLAYSATYVCRLNYSSIIPELSSLGVLSESKIASVSSAFFICYGLGQIVSGIIGDKLNTRYMIFFGVFLSSISNIILCFFNSYPVLIIFWALNGLFQSLVWSPILKLASLEYDAKMCDRFGMQMSVTVPLGTVLSYAVSLVTLMFFEWKYVFLSCGLILLIVSIIWLLGTSKLHLRKSVKVETKENKVYIKDSLKILAATGTLILLIPIIVQATLKDSVTQWVPQFFSSQFNSNTSFSLLLTMFLPVVNVTGAFFSKSVNNKLKNEAKTSAVFFAIALLFLIILLIFSSKSMLLSLISMIMVTNCMFAVNVMLITIIPLKFAKYGNVSTVAGILNATAYIGCAASNQIAGGMLFHSSWNTVIIFWLILAVVAIAFCFIYSAKKADN